MTQWAAFFLAAATLVMLLGLGATAPGAAVAAQITSGIFGVALLVLLLLRAGEQAAFSHARSNRGR